MTNSIALDAAYRLPRCVEPLLYRLTLQPNLETASFTGHEEIEVTILAPTSSIVLNAIELAIHNATIRTTDGTVLNATITLDSESERATLAFEAELEVGSATLECDFDGILNDRLHGFYRSTFVDDEGVTHTIATTQMEATDARRVFPCWDEPDRKAVFDVTLIVESGLSAFSNSAIIEQNTVSGIDDKQWQRVHFAPTMKMSTYLVAFIVGPLEATDEHDVDGIPVRVVHAPGKAYLSAFALEVAAFSLRFFTEYFNIPYPADKLDLVAIPDFAFGAMENLGCVTFRETALLVDHNNAARVELERVADVVAHELAHMWFGDLVTMGWWEGIWLNEAFATFMEVACVDAFRPAWKRWVSFGVSREGALAVDGLHTTRPIEYPVGPPSDADGMFDVLTYEKGCAVLRMLEQYLSPNVFRDGVREYLKIHAYGNTVTQDLWNALESVSGEPVARVMDSWILQGGHPLVSLHEGTLSQQPFTFGPPMEVEAGNSAIGEHWLIPLAIRSLPSSISYSPEISEGTQQTQRLLLGTEPIHVAKLLGDSSQKISDAENTSPVVVVNAGGWSVCRTSYEPEQLLILASRLDELDPLERTNLFADTWASTLAGHCKLSDFFAIAANLGSEDEPSTWGAVVSALNLCDRIVAEKDRDYLKQATRALLGSKANSLGFDSTHDIDERTPTLRAMLLRTLGTVGADPQIRQRSIELFDNSLSEADRKTPIDPDIEGAVLEIVADQLREGDYETILKRYRHPANPQEEMRSLYALASFPDVDLCLKTFDLAETEIRTQNAPYVISALFSNLVGGAAVWDRFKSKWDVLLEKFPLNSHSRMLDGVRALCTSEELAQDVQIFLSKHPVSGQRSVLQSLERLSINVAFGKKERDGLGHILSEIPNQIKHIF